MYYCFILSVVLSAVQAVDFTIVNKEGGDIWIGIQGNDKQEALAKGGFILKNGESRTVQSPSNWGGRFWARTWCNAETKHCLTGDCGNKVECNGAGGVPPVSLAEITLKGDRGLDFYDISFVDGYNVPLSFEPVNGQGDGSQYSCKKAACSQRLNNDCPDELKVNSPNGPIACKSACEKFNTDQYCCRNAYGTPDKCKSSDWPKDYPKFFKSRCPDAYSYAYDDKKSTFTCKAEKYIITFGA